MNRKSFFKTLTGGLFAGSLITNAKAEEPKPKQLTDNTLTLTNSTGDSFILIVNEAGNLEIKQIADNPNHFTKITLFNNKNNNHKI